MNISIFKQVWDTNNPYHRSVDFCLNRIKNGAVKDKVDQLRETKDDNLKRAFSGYCFNGTFKTRDAKGLIEMSGLIVLDFDDFKSYDHATEFKSKLANDPYVYSAFISPSGVGVKALVKIPKLKENFVLYFNALKKHFDCPNWDDSGKDISRFCFESYDPDLYLNQDSKLWDTLEEVEYTHIGKHRSEITVPLTSESAIIDKLDVWFNRKYPMGKGSRNNNVFIYAMALNDFGISKDTAQRLCYQWIDSDFTEKEINDILDSAYKRGFATKGSKFFEDSKVKNIIKKQIVLGKKDNEISEILADDDIKLNDAEKVINKIRTLTEFKEFWFYDDKGKIKLNPYAFKIWLEQNNFMKFYPSKSKTFTFIRKEQNFIEETNDKLIKDYVLKELLDNKEYGLQPFNMMAMNTKFFTPEFLSYLESADITIKQDTQTEAYLYFQNCALKITKDKVIEIDYLNLDGYVWKNQIIDRPYKKEDHHPSVFREFIWLVSGRNKLKYNTFKSVIGYLLHTFKTSANNKAIIFNDETISENPNGGSGKGLFWNAISKLKKVSMIDGKTFEFSKTFPYQTVSTDCQLLVFDDVKKNFSFESLFSIITEGITLEYKGQDAIKIPIEKSPKLLITTNYTVGGVGGSFDRRKFEIEFSSYFGAHNTPLDHFNHLLFDDWNEEEWSRFDSYMVNCLQYYLQHGLVEYEFGNLVTRKFIKETSFEFYEWTKEGAIKVNERSTKGKIYEDFTNEFPDYKKYLSQKRFKKWLELYATFIDAEYKEGVSQDGRWFQIYKSDYKENEPLENPFL
jgi:hypothetical protein